ncbi:MAG: PrpR N-terminal domain-containing protein [Firmicutes bacterium]|nr:PrpR N-terminal domain-containing protein [Bacillota bacterium]
MTKILGIVPYSEMKERMLTIASERNDVRLDVFVGDYRDCIRILEENLSQNYEVILSRGATATELRKRIHSVPVIDIPVSAFDLIAAVRLARNSGTKYAAVGFTSIASDFQKLKELTGDDFPVYSVSSEEETIRVLEERKAEGFGMLLCGAVAYEHALLMGIPAILISSGSECIRQAFDQAVLTAGYYKKMNEEQFFIKTSFVPRRIRPSFFKRTVSFCLPQPPILFRKNSVKNQKRKSVWLSNMENVLFIRNFRIFSIP